MKRQGSDDAKSSGDYKASSLRSNVYHGDSGVEPPFQGEGGVQAIAAAEGLT